MKPRRRNLLLGGLVGLASFAALPAQADEKGEKILREAFRKLHKAQSLTADLITERVMTGQPTIPGKGTIVLKKPNFLYVTLSRQVNSRTQKQTYVSDGTNYFNYADGSKTYMRQPAAKNPTEFTGDWEGEVDAFFGGEASADKFNADFAGTETLEGIPCDLIRITWKQVGGNRVLTYAIGQKDRLIHRTSWTAKVNESVNLTQTNRLKNIKLNGALATSAFAFVPPKDAKLYDPQVALKEMEAKLVTVGQEAPAFELTDPQTKSRVSLAKMLDGRKAVLVNFWFYN
jgi:outer membrane lipoprotein-sorting protein